MTYILKTKIHVRHLGGLDGKFISYYYLSNVLIKIGTQFFTSNTSINSNVSTTMSSSSVGYNNRTVTSRYICEELCSSIVLIEYQLTSKDVDYL